jgi:hypothetical protein
MKQIKVDHTRMHQILLQVGKGEFKTHQVLIAECKLLLVECFTERVNPLLLQRISDGQLFVANHLPELNSEVNYKGLNPLLISEKEEIKKGDPWINLKDPTLGIHYSATDHDIEMIKKMNAKNCVRIIALPHNFSGKQLAAIAFGKMKPDCLTLVECEIYGVCDGCRHVGLWHCAHADSCGNNREESRVILTERNHIILHKVSIKRLSLFQWKELFRQQALYFKAIGGNEKDNCWLSHHNEMAEQWFEEHVMQFMEKPIEDNVKGED